MKAWRDLAKLPRELWILCLSALVNRLGTMAFPFLVLYLTRSLGFTAGQAAADLVWYGAVALVVGPIAGRISDRYGALRMMESSLVASGVVLLLFPLARSLPAVFGMTALFALTNEAFRPANMALITELSPETMRKPSFALYRLAINLGMSVGPALGGFLAERSFALLFVVDGITTLVAVGILFVTSFHVRVKTREQEMRAVGSPTHEGPRHLLAAFFSDADLRYFLLCLLPVTLVFFQHNAAMPLFLVHHLHFKESAFGTLFTLNTLIIIAIEVPLNAATAHWSHRRTLALGSLLLAVGYGAMAMTHTYSQVALTIVIWTFGEMILLPGMSAYVAEISPKGRRGEYMGLYLMAFSLAFMIGPGLGTLVIERYKPEVCWGLMFVLGMVSVVLLGRTRERPKVVDEKLASKDVVVTELAESVETLV